MKPPICFYHSADLDGKCSGAIVKIALREVELYGIDYQDIPNFPWSKIKDRKVIMVDFSLPCDEMIRLKNESRELIWIDHHITAIEKLKDISILGARSSAIAACVLTWRYFFPDNAVPLSVYLIGEWDLWKHEDENVIFYHYGISSKDTNPKEPNWIYIPPLDMIIIGQHIFSYIQEADRQTMKRAYPTTIHGYKALAINAESGSKKFNQHPDKNKYDILVCYNHTNETTVRVSLYTERDNIDVSKIAETYGGGGHRKAAGYVLYSGAFVKWQAQEVK